MEGAVMMSEYVKNYDELNKRIKTDDKLLRIAILETYEYLCHYEGVPIEYTKFDIDHIIPKENLKPEKQAEWIKLKNDLNLPSDFEINSILNYVPAGDRFNRVRKGNKKLTQSAIESDLQIAKSKAKDILNTINTIKSQREIDKTKDILIEYLNEHPETIIAMAYFDLDLYEPTKKCLQLIRPYLAKNSIVAFDELVLDQFPGETQALREAWGLSNFEIIREPTSHQQGYIVVGGLQSELR